MDAIFKALADPARRDMLDALRAQDGQTLSTIEARFEMTRFGVMKHLNVLEAAGLITTVKRGRSKYHYLNPLPLQETIDRWLEPMRIKPAARGVLALKASLETSEGTPMSLDTSATAKPDIVMQTYIRCSLDALWAALTEPEEIAKYHFLTDLVERDGDTLHYEFAPGQPMLRNTNISLTPKTHIEQTFEGMWEGAGAPSRFVYHLREEGEVCSLTLEHYDLTFVAEPGEGTFDGWARLFAGLKTYLETGETVRFRQSGEA
ncbi:MAG: ArsR/SmtB family transcription factor [Shimia sp.]